MKRSCLLFSLMAAVLTAAFAQNYASYNNQPVARPSFLRSQWSNGNVLQDSSLIAYWPLIRANGTFYDYSGHGISGSFQGGISGYFGGKVGTFAPYFNKSAPNSISLSSAPTMTVPFTISVWVKPNSPIGGYTRILETDFAKGVYLGLDSSMTKYQFIVNNASVGTCSGGTVSTGTWPNQAWQMATGVYDGASGYLYVNGLQVAGPCTFTSPGTTSLPMKIGYCYIAGYCSPTSGAWDGQIGAVRIYGRVLTAAEILAIYSAEKN